MPFHLVGDREHVARRHHDDVGLEVLDELDLALGHAAAERDHGEPEALGAVVRTEPAGEEAIAVRDMNLVARPRAGGTHRARHEKCPGVDVFRGVPDDGRVAVVTDAGDLNGDGASELAVSDTGTSSRPGRVYVLFGMAAR